ncbi:MAG: hypothetical protein WA126_00070 [Thermodesulfovibrionales bacterium]
MENMDTSIRTLMGIRISTRMCILRRRKKKATSMLIRTSMNTSTSIFTNMRTKAHPACMNMRKANTAPMSISIPNMKKKSINTKRRIKRIFLWTLANPPEDRGCGSHTRTLLFHSSQVF